MNCEICKVIQKLGLPKSAHELWFCTDKVMPRRRRRVAMVQRRNRRLRRGFANYRLAGSRGTKEYAPSKNVTLVPCTAVCLTGEGGRSGLRV